LSIVATAGFEVDHTTSLLAAFSGKNVTVNISVTKGFNVVEVFDSVIPASSTGSSFLQPEISVILNKNNESKNNFGFINFDF
jgi:hypothetical protein